MYFNKGIIISIRTHSNLLGDIDDLLVEKPVYPLHLSVANFCLYVLEVRDDFVCSISLMSKMRAFSNLRL